MQKAVVTGENQLYRVAVLMLELQVFAFRKETRIAVLYHKPLYVM